MLISITRLKLLLPALMLSFVTYVAYAAKDQPAAINESAQIEPFVDVLVKQVSDYLAMGKNISVKFATSYEKMLASGQKIQLHRSGQIIARRPDRLRTDLQSDKGHRRLYFDGKQISLFDLERNVYASIEAPGTTEQAFDHAMEKFHLEIPMADFFAGDLHENFLAQTDSAFYAGLHYLDGAQYHHLVLANNNVDFQVWVSESLAPLIHKIVITYRHLPGAPQQTTVFSDWELNPIAPDLLFEFYPPIDAEQIDFLPVLNSKENKQ